MPNTGKPSPNCNLCRARRVKCDLGRPSCQRCIKYGVQCPGYRDQQTLMFRSFNPSNDKAHTSKKAKRRAEQVESSGTSDTSDTPDTSASTSRSSTPPVFVGLFDDSANGLVPSNTSTQLDFRLAKPLHEHWTVHSIPIVLNVYATLEFLSDMYSTCPPDGPLVWAAHLFARTYVINLRHPTAVHNESVTESRCELGGYMGKALSSVSTALKAPEGAFRDDILATVWILSHYELLVGSISEAQAPSPWHLHTRGMFGILKTRGIRSLRSEVGRTAFWSAFGLVQIDNIISANESPPEVEEWLSFIRENMFEDEHVSLTVAIFLHEVAAIRSQMLDIVRRDDYETASDEYLDLVGRLNRAENEANMSFEAVPAVGDGYDTYWRNLHCSAIVKCYHVTQLLVNFLSHHAPCRIPIDQLQAQHEYCLQRMRSAADEILSYSSTILDTKLIRSDKSPKFLFDAFKVVWPLTSVYTTASVLPSQRSQAEMALYFIGHELGVKQALHTYPGSSAARLPSEERAPLRVG
ncbi:hypothetical protein ACO1O0_000456 [Amphichorda felina]